MWWSDLAKAMNTGVYQVVLLHWVLARLIMVRWNDSFLIRRDSSLYSRRER